MKRLSIRLKLLALLTILPIAFLGAYLVIATNVFKEDKEAYVYDTSLSHSQSVSAQTTAYFEEMMTDMKNITSGYNWARPQFYPTSQTYFKNKESLNYFAIYSLKEGQYKRDVDLTKENDKKIESEVEKILSDVQQRTLKSDIVFERLPLESSFLLAYRLGDPSHPRHRILLSVHTSQKLVDVFNQNSTFASFLINSKGDVILGQSPQFGEIKSFTDWELYKDVGTKGQKPRTGKSFSPDGEAILSSYSPVSFGRLSVLTVVTQAAAFAAVKILLVKSIIFFILLISLSVMISLFVSNKLTRSLRSLAEATKEISSGNFDIKVEESSRDEVGTLAESFNFMTDEVSRLMGESVEKARMEKELETAKTVQETLFPPRILENSSCTLLGRYTPASECGGDWWHYFILERNLYLMIGDATGHGAPAALVTSAAKSASTVLQNLEVKGLTECMDILNKAIYETSKGKIMMTFFMAKVEFDTGKFEYCNASHDPPYLINRNEGEIKKRDIITLNEVNNPRLGEQKNVKFESAEIKLNKDDSIVFYTDGVFDIKSPEGKIYGERNFIKSVTRSLSHGVDLKNAMDEVNSQLDDFRRNENLDDDITMMMYRYKGAA